MSGWKLITALLGAAVLLGWFMAPPEPATGQGDADAAAPGLDGPGAVDPPETEEPLQRLYQRRAWSAQQPEAPESDEAADQHQSIEPVEPPPRPEGLERFTLVGIIEVSNRPTEALFLDAGAEEQPPVFRAQRGDTLRGTGAVLQRLEGSSAELVLGEERRRQLSLFPRPGGETPGGLPDPSNTTD